MKILLVHNYYGSSAPSGENRVFESELDLLRRKNNDVEVFTRNSDEIRESGMLGMLKGGLVTPWNLSTANAIKKIVDKFKPQIVHAHNTFPLISPAIFHSIGVKAAKILTLHNYRLFCSAGIPLRHGKVCTECIDKNTSFYSLKYGCYRNSRISTVPLAISVELHKRLGTWKNCVDAFIALTEFQKGKMADAGLDINKIFIKPNFYPGNPIPVPWGEREPFVIYAGRLSAEKGVETLVKAWNLWGGDAPELRIIGDGPLKKTLKEKVKNPKIKFLDLMPPEQAQEQIARSKLMVLPSEGYEGFPRVLGEALAFGTPIAVSSIVPLSEVFKKNENIILFKASDPMSLMEEIKSVWEVPGLLEKMGKKVRKINDEHFSEESNYETLLSIYEIGMKRNESLRNNL
jgi:glycosyltransferase involved in cell wall biosynthesis